MWVKAGMVIWAKLTQGNGRGTCCWIKYNFYELKFKILMKFFFLILRFVALRGCPNDKCYEERLSNFIKRIGVSENNKTNK